MSKAILYILFFLAAAKASSAQEQDIITLRHQIENSQNDTLKIMSLRSLTEGYRESNQDSCIYFAQELLNLSRKLDFKLDQGFALAQMGFSYINLGNYSKSLQSFHSAVALAEDPNNEQNVLPYKYINKEEFLSHPITAHMRRLALLARVHLFWGVLYENTKNYAKAGFNYIVAHQFAEESQRVPELVGTNITLGRYYLSQNKPDSGFYHEQKAYDLSKKTGSRKYLGSILLNLGRIYSAKGKRQLAATYFTMAIDSSKATKYPRGVVAANLELSDLYSQSGRKDSGLHYANEALRVAMQLKVPNLLLRVDTTLAGYYRSAKNKDSTLKYQELIIRLNDSLFSSKQTKLFDNIDFEEQQRQQEIESAKEASRVKIRMYALIAGVAIFLLLAAVLWRNNLQRRKANALLSRQKEELQSALTQLKTTQNQLIQAEKMASLGELTAGIAHEIQNPLNFVNNFSEVNAELLDELENEFVAGNKESGKAISSELKQNLEKVIHHGKRADAIVKGMLQHSRISSGNKEQADINALAEKYLRLSYHGFQAKDKSFSATTKTDFEQSIREINIVPEDIGRALLNLFNNAFYSVNEKRKSIGREYDPELIVSTRKMGNKIEIRVKDNGLGIPKKNIDKIFQPFFTTKPTGLGTGLGLSLSYDIITKEHGGEIKVETREGEYTEFIIYLPVL